MEINTLKGIQSNSESVQAILMARKAQSQQKLEGQMALALIQSASPQVTSPTESIGNTINIKV